MLRCLNCQNEFKKLTSNTEFLSSIFGENKDINVLTKKFLKRLNGCLYKCFRKIKVNDKQNKELDYLFRKRKELRIKHDDESKEELKKVEEELSNRCASDNYKDEIEAMT